MKAGGAADAAAHVEHADAEASATSQALHGSSVVATPPVLMYPSPKIISYRKIPVRLYWPWLSNFGVAAGAANWYCREDSPIQMPSHSPWNDRRWGSVGCRQEQSRVFAIIIMRQVELEYKQRVLGRLGTLTARFSKQSTKAQGW